jgi:hypothetical protein
VRGYGRCYQEEDDNILWANLEYLQKAGIERLYLKSEENPACIDLMPAQNQADLLYFSGHGRSEDGKIYSETQFTTPIRWEDIGATSWTQDLDVFVIAACSVLDIQTLTGSQLYYNYGGDRVTANMWGLGWSNYFLTARTPGGPLDALCGYYDTAPGDASGLTQGIAQRFSGQFNGANAPDAWRQAHDADGGPRKTYWCAMDASTYQWNQNYAPGLWRPQAATY